MSTKIINDPAYLRDAQTTQYELQTPPPQVWDDGSEWRLISWLAFAVKPLQTSTKSGTVLAAVEEALNEWKPQSIDIETPRGRWRLLYGSPYSPILQTAQRQIQTLDSVGKGTIVAVGQSLVNLPSAPVTTLFWKRDVVEYKRAEQKAARTISRLAGLNYETDPLKQPKWVQTVLLKDGPSWRWWTEQLNH